jgi:hypothetical protein
MRRICLAICLLLSACHHVHPPTTRPGVALVPDTDVNAMVAIPPNWHPDPLKSSAEHTHQVWISPSGHTAYGVIYFKLPLPVGTDLALWGFLNQMKKSEGEATLLSKQYDPKIDGLRFVAEGGLYTVRTTLFTEGFHGWAIYAGTLRKFPVNAEELREAERAREATRIGIDSSSANNLTPGSTTRPTTR